MYDYKNKEMATTDRNDYMFLKTLEMFRYEGLPDTIPYLELEKQLQRNGYSFITEIKGELYALKGSFGGEPDVYGNPTKIVITNTALNFSKELDIKEDGILVRNDDLMKGLFPLIDRFNSLMTENEVSMYVDNYNNRIQTLISAGDDSTKESAKKYIDDIVKGEIGIIGENRIFEGIKTQNTKQNAQNTIQQLIELNQYLKSNIYNELGINSNHNMKRERLNTKEVEMDSESLVTLVNNMKQNRLEFVKSMSEKYNIEMSVEFGSIWEQYNEQEETEEPSLEEGEKENITINLSSENVTLTYKETESEEEETEEEETEEEETEEEEEETEEETEETEEEEEEEEEEEK